MEAAALIDGENYFRAFHRAALAARRYILIAGWQFELETRLLRGPEAERSELPVTFWSFLRALCERREQLGVYVLSWDYSLVYVLERQWLQAARAKLSGHPRLRLVYRAHPDGIGSHHQKLVVIDDQLAFIGGIDFCESRWDTRTHAPHDGSRRNALGLPAKPYHDIQAVVSGPVVADFTELYREAWNAASHKPLDLPPLPAACSAPPLRTLLDTELHALPSGDMVVCRTLPRTQAAPAVREIQSTYEHLICRAEQMIYIETQYFTSSAIGEALRARLADAGRPKLAVVIIMPNGADSPKEHFVLGGRQDQILCSLRSTAARYGHDLRILCVAGEDEAGQPVVTFIHSKLMIVDDRAITFGSANLTNRSMSFDSELNLAWNLELPAEPVARIRDLRASLIAEHAGRDAALFSDASTLIRRLDDELSAPGSKLRLRPLDDIADDDSLWTAVFDPSTELWAEHSEDLKAYARDAKSKSVIQRLFWTARLALRLAQARRSIRRQRARRASSADAAGKSAVSGESSTALALKFLVGLIVLYALVAVVGSAFAEPMKELGRGFVRIFGLPGFGVGTFLADGLHFPVPPQFYMLMTVALEKSPAWSLVSITIGSILGGALGFVAAQRLSYLRWLERRFSGLRASAVAQRVESHPYRWVIIASLTPVAFSWLCYLAGFYRFPRRAFALLCVLRVPKLLVYFAIVRAGWTHVFQV